YACSPNCVDDDPGDAARLGARTADPGDDALKTRTRAASAMSTVGTKRPTLNVCFHVRFRETGRIADIGKTALTTELGQKQCDIATAVNRTRPRSARCRHLP